MPTRLQERLIDSGLISEEHLNAALAITSTTRQPLATVLRERDLVDETALLPVLADFYGLPFVHLRDERIETAAVRMITPKLAAHYEVMPVRFKDGVLTLAVSDPMDTAASEDIETNIGCHVERVLACHSEIVETLRQHYGVGAETVERIQIGGGAGYHTASRWRVVP